MKVKTGITAPGFDRAFAPLDSRTAHRDDVRRDAHEWTRKQDSIDRAEFAHGRLGRASADRAARRASRSSLPWSVWALLIAGWLVLSALLAVAAWSVAS